MLRGSSEELLVQAQGCHRSCGSVNVRGSGRLGRCLLLSARILLLMPSLLRVIGTIVHDTDFIFFLRALKM